MQAEENEEFVDAVTGTLFAYNQGCPEVHLYRSSNPGQNGALRTEIQKKITEQ